MVDSNTKCSTIINSQAIFHSQKIIFQYQILIQFPQKCLLKVAWRLWLAWVLEKMYQNRLFKEKFGFFCPLSLVIRIFMIIYDVLQHCYDNWCSPDSWSSLLTFIYFLTGHCSLLFKTSCSTQLVFLVIIMHQPLEIFRSHLLCLQVKKHW